MKKKVLTQFRNYSDYLDDKLNIHKYDISKTDFDGKC